jgi:uncharacterized protein
MKTEKDRLRIQGLEELMGAAAASGQAPVDQWEPPYCGDIGLAIGADGTWFYRGSPIGRANLVKLFARVLRRDEDGRYFLVTPVEKVDVAVADAPFLAVEMEIWGKGVSKTLAFRTNVDDVVTCGPERPLRFAAVEGNGGMKPYVLVRGRLEALVVRSVTHELLELVEPNETGTPSIWSGGFFFPIVPSAESTSSV